MNCEEIKKNIEDYIDNQLDEKTKSDLEDSLPYCAEQDGYLKRINALSKQLNELPLSFEPPKEVIIELTDKLMQLSETAEKTKLDQEKLSKIDEQSREHRPVKKKKRNLAKSFKDLNISNFSLILTGMTAVVILITIYFITFFNDTSPWKANASNGTFKVNNTTVTTANLESDDIVTSLGHTSTGILIPEEGSFTLDPETSIQIVETKKSLNKISLLSGGITFKSISKTPNFELQSNGVTIKSQNAQFAAKIDSNGYLIVRGIKEHIEIVTEYDRLLLGNDYICRISGNIIGLPYHVKATGKFKHQLRNMEANMNDVVELTALLYDASYKDAHTIIRLLEKVSKGNREIVYKKLSNLFPPTPRVTKQGIIDGNQSMLDEWWFEIDWQI